MKLHKKTHLVLTNRHLGRFSNVWLHRYVVYSKMQGMCSAVHLLHIKNYWTDTLSFFQLVLTFWYLLCYVLTINLETD